MEHLLSSGVGIFTGKIKRLGHIGSCRGPEKKFQRLGRLEHRLHAVEVGEREAVVMALGMSHQDGDDVVGELGGKGRMGQVF